MLLDRQIHLDAAVEKASEAVVDNSEFSNCFPVIDGRW